MNEKQYKVYLETKIRNLKRKLQRMTKDNTDDIEYHNLQDYILELEEEL
jgi:hypothetical protein